MELLFVGFLGGFILAYYVFNRLQIPGNDVAAEPCPRCRASMNPARPCQQCGWDLGGKVTRKAIARVISKLTKAGKIDTTVQTLIIEALNQEAKLPKAPQLDQATAQNAPAIRAELIGSDEQPSQPKAADRPSSSNAGVSRPSAVPPTKPAPKPIASPATPQPSMPKTEPLEPVGAVSIRDRAQAYEASRQAAAEQQPEVQPPKPKVPWSVWFAAFMEEKNIRWGELVGGLLIVSCTIALVVTFWANIAENRFLKFGVLNGVIAALFAVGLHAARRWKLPTTSQGILTIATLLVPLNFLALAAFAKHSETLDPITIVGEVISVGLFSYFVLAAGRFLTPRWPGWLTVGVLVPSVCQLLIKRVAEGSANPSSLYVVAMPCLLAYGIACWNPIQRYRHKASIPERYGNELLKQLGLVAFPLLTAGGLLLTRATEPALVLEQLSPLSILLALPIVSLGALLWKHPGSSKSSHQLVGSTLCVIGTFIFVGGCVVAWPQPALLIALAALGGAAITYSSKSLQLVDGHVVAVGLFAVSLLFLAHVLVGDLTWFVSSPAETIQALTSVATGQYLVGVAIVLAAIAAALRHFAQLAIAIRYAVCGGLCLILSTVILTFYGFNVEGDPYHLTWIYTAYALILFAVSFLSRMPLAVGFGAALLLAGCYQGFYMGPWRIESSHLIYVLCLTHATAVAVVAAIARGFRPQANHLIRTVSSVLAMGSSAIVACGLLRGVVQVFHLGQPLPLPFMFWLIGLWLALAFIERSEIVFILFQAALGLLLMVLLDSYSVSRGWYQLGDSSWLHPTRLQVHGLLFSIYSLVWILARATTRNRSTHGKQDGIWPFNSNAVRYFDGALLFLPTIIVIFLVLYGVIPGIAQELSSTTAGAREVPEIQSFQLGDAPIERASNGYTWLLIAVLVVSRAMAFVERPQRWNLSAIALIVSLTPLLIAANWYDTVSVASATRWTCAIYFLVGSAILWARRPIAAWICRKSWLGSSQFSRVEWYSFGTLVFYATVPLVGMAIFVAISALSKEPPSSSESTWWLVLALTSLLALGAALAVSRTQSSGRGWQVLTRSAVVLGAMPVFALTLFVVGRSLGNHPIIGPNDDSLFAQMGLAGSYAIPLLLLSVGMVGNAISLRSEAVSFTAGMLLTFSATAGYMLTLRGTLGVEQCITLAQINSIVTACYALGWIAYQRLRRWVDREEVWLTAQVGVGVGFIALPLAACAMVLVGIPEANHPIGVVAGWLGWASFLLAAGSIVALMRARSLQRPVLLSKAGLVGFVAMCAVQSSVFSPSGTTGNWFAFYVLQVACIITSIVLAIIDATRFYKGIDRSCSWLSRGALPLAISLIYFGFRSLNDSASISDWMSISAWISAAVLFAFLAWQTQKHRSAFWATLLGPLAFSYWWMVEGHQYSNSTGAGLVLEYMFGNVIVINLLVVLWSFLLYPSSSTKRRFPSIQFLSLLFSMLVIAAMIGSNLIQDATGSAFQDHYMPMQVLALLSLAVANLSCLWYPRNALAVIGCYCVGLLASGVLLESFNLRSAPMVWNATLVLASYGFVTSYLWSRRQGIGKLLAPLRLPVNDELQRKTQEWLIPLNGLLAIVVTALALRTQFTCDVLSLRLACSQAIAAMAFSMGMLARGTREMQLRWVALMLGAVAAVAFGWCWIVPGGPYATLLNRAVVFTGMVISMAAFYGIGLSKILRRENAWTRAGQQFVPVLGCVGGMSLLGILAGEMWLYVAIGTVELPIPAVLVVSAALCIAAVACLVAAVVPGRDPLNLPERHRSYYIYGVEALCGMLFLHLRVTMPFLFTGFFQQYWTIIVMAIAFAGIGMSEWFKRRQIQYLSEPLEKTGALLPLLPVIGFWVTDQSVDYSIVMITVGCLYAALSVMRKSFGFGVLATLSANGALWFFLHNTVQIEFLAHPQLWLIPGTICVLIAAYLNRDKLAPSQMNSIRYLCVSVIYASSTADIFINGVGNAPWLPAILAAFSIAGIFAGILMHVRAFLFTGLSFLVISLMTVVWYAAVDLEQTWLWYVTGIVAGVIIITVFAIFEKKRNDVIDVVTKLKSWE